jgi:hypothetical protein
MHHNSAHGNVLELPNQPGPRCHAGYSGDIADRRRRPHRLAKPPGHQRRGGHRHRGLHHRHEAQQHRKLRIDRSASGHQTERRRADHSDR